MPSPLLRRPLERAAAWEAQAAERRRISAVDPVADTLEHCAREVRAACAAAEAELTHLSPEQWIAIQPLAERVSVQTVRGWIRRGELEASEGPNGYLIPREAKRVRALRRAS